jgi:hypothetical protein
MSRLSACTGRLAAVAAAALAVLSAPAQGAAPSKSKPQKYTYTATIDCGAGDIVVASTDDLFAPLLDRATGRTYQPVEWDVTVNGKTVRATKPGWHGGATTTCSYDDGQAVGTVTVRRTRRHAEHQHKHSRGRR